MRHQLELMTFVIHLLCHVGRMFPFWRGVVIKGVPCVLLTFQRVDIHCLEVIDVPQRVRAHERKAGGVGD
jgi:hypothetical protein